MTTSHQLKGNNPHLHQLCPAEQKFRKNFRYIQKLASKRKLQNQDLLKGCLICFRSCANMRQHLTKTNQFSKRHHNFLLSFHRTQICTSTVYQCNTCSFYVRFTGKKNKHKKSCKNPHIFCERADSEDEFPVDIKEYVPTPPKCIVYSQSTMKTKLIQGPTLDTLPKNFLIRVVDVTKHFRKSMHLKIVLNLVKCEKNYTIQTKRNFHFELSRLIEYCKCYKQKKYSFNPDFITGELRTLLRSTAKKPQKMSTAGCYKFDKVPNLYQVAHLRQMVKELLQNHP